MNDDQSRLPKNIKPEDIAKEFLESAIRSIELERSQKPSGTFLSGETKPVERDEETSKERLQEMLRRSAPDRSSAHTGEIVDRPEHGITGIPLAKPRSYQR